MTWQPSLWLVGASFALTCIAQPLAAQPSPAERETARNLMNEGDRLRSAGDLRGALSRFQAAHAIMHVPTTGLDVARTQAQLGLLVEARSTATEVMHSPVAADEPRVFAQARTAASELATELEAQVPALKTVVSPSDAEYTLAIDGVTLPAAARGVAFRANPGPHSVRIEAAGHAPESRQVTLVEGQTQTLAVVLNPLPASTPALQPAAAVAASPSPPQPSGPRDFEDPAGPGRVRGIVGLSVGGASLVVGAVTGVLSITKTNHIKKFCDPSGCDASQSDALSSAETLANVANVTIPIGVLGIAYGLYELLTLPSAPAEKQHVAALQFELTPTGAGLRGAL